MIIIFNNLIYFIFNSIIIKVYLKEIDCQYKIAIIKLMYA